MQQIHDPRLAAARASCSAFDQISLRISPGEANLNQRTCFKGRVRNGNRRRVAGAKVLLGTAKDRSNRRGKVRLCDALKWPGVHTAQAFKGSRDDLARIRVRSGGTTANGIWTPLEVRLLAYRDGGTGGCPRSGGFQDTWGDGRGSCKGRAQDGTPGPFSGNDITVLWDQGASLIDVKTYYSSNTGWYMKGDVPSRSSGLYTIREGYFRPVLRARGHRSREGGSAGGAAADQRHEAHLERVARRVHDPHRGLRLVPGQPVGSVTPPPRLGGGARCPRRRGRCPCASPASRAGSGGP